MSTVISFSQAKLESILQKVALPKGSFLIISEKVDLIFSVVQFTELLLPQLFTPAKAFAR